MMQRTINSYMVHITYGRSIDKIFNDIRALTWVSLNEFAGRVGGWVKNEQMSKDFFRSAAV